MTQRAIILLFAWWCGCGEPAPAPPMPEPSSTRLDGTANGPVEGQIAGRAWRLAEARFDIVTRPGRQRVDLVLWDVAVERCGLPVERSGATVWLRFPGRTSLETGEHTLDAEGGPFEAHYEVPSEEGFVESHRGVATVRIDEVAPRVIRGRLRVCFADRERSCVGGTFDAAPCWSRIDGRALREPPGLRDEALEPVPRGEP